MIREASDADLHRLVEMGRNFVEALDIGVPPDDESITKTLRGLMSGIDSVLYVGDGGMIGGLFYPHFFNQKVYVAQEMFWWVDYDKRGTGLGMELIKRFEEWAESMGADQIVMISLANQPVDVLYNARGYAPMESSFVRSIWQ